MLEQTPTNTDLKMKKKNLLRSCTGSDLKMKKSELRRQVLKVRKAVEVRKSFVMSRKS
jgi:hypothetical protein